MQKAEISSWPQTQEAILKHVFPYRYDFSYDYTLSDLTNSLWNFIHDGNERILLFAENKSTEIYGIPVKNYNCGNSLYIIQNSKRNNVLFKDTPVSYRNGKKLGYSPTDSEAFNSIKDSAIQGYVQTIKNQINNKSLRPFSFNGGISYGCFILDLSYFYVLGGLVYKKYTLNKQEYGDYNLLVIDSAEPLGSDAYKYKTDKNRFLFVQDKKSGHCKLYFNGLPDEPYFYYRAINIPRHASKDSPIIPYQVALDALYKRIAKEK